MKQIGLLILVMSLIVLVRHFSIPSANGAILCGDERPIVDTGKQKVWATLPVVCFTLQ